MRTPRVTPAARITAAIEILDATAAAGPVEAVIAAWARRNRYAGSKDRSAIRDHVYDVLRCRRSLAARGGGESGRALMLGLVRTRAIDPMQVFTGARHAPRELADGERAPPHGPWPAGVELDCPDWLLPRLDRALGPHLVPVLRLLQERAPVHLRANLRRTSRAELSERLAAEAVEVVPQALSPSALEVRAGARHLRRTRSFAEGLFELQDAASQAISDLVPVVKGSRVLDYCAGAGGKTLAMAGRANADWFAHDIDARRMSDIASRAARAGIRVTRLSRDDVGCSPRFDTVLVDAPCSGSGSWRRDPEGKWALNERRLKDLTRLQAGILDAAAPLAVHGGTLAFATCSMLDEENRGAAQSFLRRATGWRLMRELRLTPLDGGDGFYLALLKRE